MQMPIARTLCAAGENPSRNAELAPSENGPAGTSSKVVMRKLYQPASTIAESVHSLWRSAT
jgi:hypothetical protein